MPKVYVINICTEAFINAVYRILKKKKNLRFSILHRMEERINLRNSHAARIHSDMYLQPTSIEKKTSNDGKLV